MEIQQIDTKRNIKKEPQNTHAKASKNIHKNRITWLSELFVMSRRDCSTMLRKKGKNRIELKKDRECAKRVDESMVSTWEHEKEYLRQDNRCEGRGGSWDRGGI